jgi:hypothetical protein
MTKTYVPRRPIAHDPVMVGFEIAAADEREECHG